MAAHLPADEYLKLLNDSRMKIHCSGLEKPLELPRGILKKVSPFFERQIGSLKGNKREITIDGVSASALATFVQVAFTGSFEWAKGVGITPANQIQHIAEVMEAGAIFECVGMMATPCASKLKAILKQDMSLLSVEIINRIFVGTRKDDCKTVIATALVRSYVTAQVKASRGSLHGEDHEFKFRQVMVDNKDFALLLTELAGHCLAGGTVVGAKRKFSDPFYDSLSFMV